MSDPDRKQSKEPSPEKEPFVPASPVKRALAWIGIVYMVILILLTTYIYATGAPLTNLAPLLAVPALVGLGIVCLISWRTAGRPGKWAAIALAALCWAAAAYSLPLGIRGLLSNFGG